MDDEYDIFFLELAPGPHTSPNILGTFRYTQLDGISPQEWASIEPAFWLASRILTDRTLRMRTWWATVMTAHLRHHTMPLPTNLPLQSVVIESEVDIVETVWESVGEEGRIRFIVQGEEEVRPRFVLWPYLELRVSRGT